MQIITVSYGKTVNLGNYESARLDATAQVESGETPEDALSKLKTWVEGQAEQATQQIRKPAEPKGWK